MFVAHKKNSLLDTCQAMSYYSISYYTQNKIVAKFACEGRQTAVLCCFSQLGGGGDFESFHFYREHNAPKHAAKVRKFFEYTKYIPLFLQNVNKWLKIANKKLEYALPLQPKSLIKLLYCTLLRLKPA